MNNHISKLRWTDDQKRNLYAGGILLTDKIDEKEGFWIIAEHDLLNRLVYTDIGGRYDYNDGDIFGTITREFREETYNQTQILYKDVIKSDLMRIYIKGYNKAPVYLCIVAPIEKLGLNREDLQNIDIQQARNKIIKSNQNIPEKWYRTREFKFISLEDIKNDVFLISKRLQEILTNI